MEKFSALCGCLLGLAVGDALGYTVDNKNLEQIREDYGPNGLMGYDLVNGHADVTSYTQIAAFAANGLLLGLTQGMRAPLPRYVALALREWSRSQHYCDPEKNFCWLSTVPELKRKRCMDTWILSLLSRPTMGTMETPVSRSDHPSGLTAAVPVALIGPLLPLDQEALDRLGAEVLALTHGPEAFLCGAVLTHALSAIVREPGASADALLRQTMDAIGLQFGREYPQVTALWELLQLAQALASSPDIPPAEAMERLGCRTAPEVLAGALYACSVSRGDFDTAMITAVNHSGRSAAVGAVTGAILGAYLGYEALPEFYLESLEPAQYLTELARDLCEGCPGGGLFDDEWERKYRHAGQ